MSRIPLHFHRIDTAQSETPYLRASRSIPDYGKACFAEMDKLAILSMAQTCPFPLWSASYRDSRRPLHRQSQWSPPQTGMNMYRNRIPSTIPFPRQAPDLTRHRVPLRSMLKCEGNMVSWCSVVLRKDKWNLTVIPQSPFACAGPNLRSGTSGTTHRHVTGPQVVPQCSLKEQPSVHAILIFRRFSSDRERAPRNLQTYLSLKESCSYTIESNSGMNNPLQKNILTRFFLPDSHNRRGESGLSGRRHGRNVSDVDELQVLVDRRRTERTSEGARRSRSRGTHLWVMGISIMPLTDQKCSKDAIA
ncbi:MAG: hypothetical protein A4E58_02537 [Syntrophorhabdus sp. PtaB.Bin006]|nr:MAG: hypothetical protein A4E58_02537 [Syntrophorhabdus sp. PtaB.Bin006]